MNLRLASQKLNRISSEPKLYGKFDRKFTNLKALTNRSVTEEFRDYLQRYYQIMCSNFWFPNVKLCQPNIGELIDEQIRLALNSEFINHNTNLATNGFTHKLCYYLYKSTEIDVDILRSILKKMDHSPTQEQKERIFNSAIQNEATNLEVFKFLVEELEYPVPEISNSDLKKFNEEIENYIWAARITQLYKQMELSGLLADIH